MTEARIKKLAKLTLLNGKINKEVADFALSSLSRKPLFKYLGYLKKQAFENSVRIVSSEKLSTVWKNKIEEKFSGKNIFYETDSLLGDGIMAIMGDTVLDLTLKNYLDNITENIKN